MSGVIPAKFDVVLEVAGVRYDIVAYAADFTLNQIPKASCMMSVGRRADSGVEFAKIHSSLSEFAQSRNIAKVYFCPSGKWSEENDWPPGEHLIFEGRVVGVGVQKQSGQLQLIAHLQHWLGDLNFSSTMSAQSHPANPSQYTFAATVGVGLNSIDSGPPAALAGSSADSTLGALAISTDFWGEALKPLFCTLASAEHVRFHGDLRRCFGLEEQDNTQALAALSRIEGVSELSESPGTDCNLERSCYTPKLALSIEGGQDTQLAIADSIADSVMQHTIQSFENQTIWGKLVGQLGPEFLFGIVPMIDRALVVPVSPGIRATWCKRIYACDYDPISYEAEIVRPVRGVAIFGSSNSKTGLFDSQTQRNIYVDLGIGGCWAPVDQTEGQVLVRRMPRWLENVGVTGITTAATLGLSGDPPSATTPKDSDDEELLGRSGGESTEDVLREASVLFADYAHALYLHETLRGRNGSLSGKLRFDIAPGSNVWIEGTGERFATGEDALNQNMIGLVMRVSIALNAETAKAGTALKLTFMRTEAENADDRTSADCHPLYVTKFPGAPLSDDLWFADEGDGCCEAGTNDGEELIC